MNEKVHHYIIYALFILTVIALSGFAFQTNRLASSRAECEYYRTELESAVNREQLLADTIDDCYQSTERTKQILSSTANTIGQLKEQLREARETYQDMEIRLLDCYDRLHNNNYTVEAN